MFSHLTSCQNASKNASKQGLVVRIEAARALRAAFDEMAG